MNCGRMEAEETERCGDDGAIGAEEDDEATTTADEDDNRAAAAAGLPRGKRAVGVEERDAMATAFTMCMFKCEKTSSNTFDFSIAAHPAIFSALQEQLQHAVDDPADRGTSLFLIFEP
jgi:hypothetical protein